MANPDNPLTAPGGFVVGCNYWASHAGTAMWSDWRPKVVAADLRQLAAEGLQVLRVFPLWPVFQPLTQIYGGGGHEHELRLGEQPLGDDEFGRAGISAAAMDRFRFLADQAQAQGLTLIVGLVTGWMSGRLFVPPAFERLNVLTDARVLQWQLRFVRTFVRHFREHPAIAAWDLGNECNCMAPVARREEAWLWTASIANAIRVEDPTRPVVSGMHSLSPGRKAHWHIQDQGELTDLLTTHPYPAFTPYCDQDPINQIRNGLHATAEGRFYGDIGGVPCLCEEIGILGPTICSEAIAADYARMALYSLWAHDGQGLLWWCAYDQTRLSHAPYDWNHLERELGLIRENRDPKPTLREIGAFAARLRELPFDRLPTRRREAVCILSDGQDQWAAAYAAFVLAKQAGFDLQFQTALQPLRPADLYLLPSVAGYAPASRSFWLELLARVEAGATLYVSHADCFMEPFAAAFGLEIQTRERSGGQTRVIVPGCCELLGQGPFRLRLQATTAEVLAHEPDGNPVVARNRLGKGQVYFCSLPIEQTLSQTPGAFHGPQAQPWWQLYAQVAEKQLAQRLLRRDNPTVGVTEHELPDGTMVAVAINYSPAPQTVTLSLAKAWRVKKTLIGPAPKSRKLKLPPNDAAVLLLAKG